MRKGQEFEILIESIYKELDPTSIITRNDKIFGHDSRQNREIDLSIRCKIGIHPILMIVQAKDYSNPVDINVIGEFKTVIEDTRANKGVLISAKGFTAGAKKTAKTYGIDLLTAHDTTKVRWKIDLQIPVIFNTFQGDFDLTFKLVFNDDYVEKVVKSGRKIPLPKGWHYLFTSDKGKSIIIPIEDFKSKYSRNELNACGTLQHLSYPNMDLVVENNLYVPAQEIRINYNLVKKSYYRFFGIKEFRGLIDDLTEKISPTHYKIESDEIIIENNTVKVIKPFKLSKWNPVDNSTYLNQPFKINLFHLPKLESGGPAKLKKIN